MIQKRLFNIQQSTYQYKITPIIAVDLLKKVELSFQLNIVLTKDALEYITPVYLQKTIEDLIISHRKLKKNEISTIIQVIEEKFEGILAKIIEENDQIKRIDDFYYIEAYFIMIIDEINKQLTLESVLFLSDLSLKYEISINFFKNKLISFIKTGKIKGEIYDDKLISLEFTYNLQRKIKGAIKGSFFPISLFRIKEIIEIKGFSINCEEISEKIQKMIENHEIKGKIMDFCYFQDIFTKKRDEFIQKSFTMNKYIKYDDLAVNFIKSPLKYLKDNFPTENIEFYDNFAVLTEFFDNFIEIIQIDVQNDGFCSLEKLFSFTITQKDCEALLASKPGIFDMNLYDLEGMILFNHKIIEEICVECRVKMKKIYKNKKLKKKNDFYEIIEKEMDCFPNIKHDITTKNALGELIYRKILNFSDFNENKGVIHSFNEKFGSLIKNALNSTKFLFSREFNFKNQLILDKLFNQSINLIEMTIFFNLKRFSIEVPSNFTFIDDFNQMDLFSEEFQIFKNKDFAEKSIEFLPENIGNLIKKTEEMVLNEEFEEFFEFLESNEEVIFGGEIGIGVKIKEEFHSPQKNKKKKLKHKKSRSTF